MRFSEVTPRASSSFCNSMVAAVARLFRINLDNIEVARITSEIEMNRAATESGFQDQYASAIGGISLMHFDSKGFIGSEKIFIGSEELEVIKWLNEHTIFLRVNGSRNSSDILRSIDFDDNKILEKQKEIVNLVPEMVKAIRKRDVIAYGNCLEHNWNLKKEINSNSSTQEVDSLHDLSVQYGAIGGKLLGAGSSGYLAMVVPNLTDPLRELIGNQLQLKISGQELITKEI